MRFLAFCFLASALLVANADGASLLRFINTVPALLQEASLMDKAAGDHAVHPNSNTDFHNWNVDRVGLLYYADSKLSGLAPATVVWTESLYWLQCKSNAAVTVADAAAPLVGDEKTIGSAPWAWDNAMPPLRHYHMPYNQVLVTSPKAQEEFPVSAEPAAVDKVAIYTGGAGGTKYTGLVCGRFRNCAKGSTTPGKNDDCRYKDGTDGGTVYPQHWDPYDHSQLKADGVGLYMSFAPGRYRLQAYGAKGTVTTDMTTRGGATGQARLRKMTKFAGSLDYFTFEDNKVYTMFAIGQVSWLVAALTNTVTLKLVEENVGRTTFGMASVRFFHAITKLSSTTSTQDNIGDIDVYVGPVKDSDKALVSGLKFATVSDYMDIAPKENAFPLATPQGGGNLVGGLPIISVDQTRVTVDLRAGTRATIVCAQHDMEVSEVFCRQIPSRVVAYVRLVNDLLDYTGKIQGRFGPEAMNQSPLTLWQSYQYPRPDVVMDGARDMGQSMAPGVTSNGLMSIVSDVAAGSVSGYGEVQVPLYIMDWQTDPEVGPSCGSPIAGGATHTAGKNQYNVEPDDLGCYNARPDSSDPADKHQMDFGHSGAGGMNVGTQTAAGGNSWPAWAPRFKRVNLILKTAGFASLGNYFPYTRLQLGATKKGVLHAQEAELVPQWIPINTVDGGSSNDDDKLKADKNARNTGISPLLDRYMEPGEYYTVYVVPRADPETQFKSGVVTKVSGKVATWPKNLAPTTGGQWGQNVKILNLHLGQSLEFGLTRDRTVQTVASGIDATQASVTVVPFRRSYLADGLSNNTQLGQDFRGTFKFTPRVTSAADRSGGNQKTVTKTGINAGFEWYRSWDQAFGKKPAKDDFDNIWPAAPDPIALQPGTYTLDFVAATPATSQSLEKRDSDKAPRPMTWDTDCSSNIPTFEFTVEAGKFYSLFVLGQYGCRQRCFHSTWQLHDFSKADPPEFLTGVSTSKDKLVPTLVEALPFGGKVAGAGQGRGVATPQAFFSAASPVSSSVSMLLLAALAAVLVAFL